MDNQTRQQQPLGTKSTLRSTQLLTTAAVVVLVAIASFIGGVQYQKGHVPKSNAANAFSQNGPGQGMRGFNRNGAFGSVTAISANSISVQDQRASTAKTYTIDSSTTIDNNGSAATYTDIKVGDSVLVQTSSSTSTTATTIRINPSTAGQSSQQSSTSNSSNNTAVTN